MFCGIAPTIQQMTNKEIRNKCAQTAIIISINYSYPHRFGSTPLTICHIMVSRKFQILEYC